MTYFNSLSGLKVHVYLRIDFFLTHTYIIPQLSPDSLGSGLLRFCRWTWENFCRFLSEWNGPESRGKDYICTVVFVWCDLFGQF